MSSVWARGEGISLRRLEETGLELPPGIERGLLDGIERGYAGPLPACDKRAEHYWIEAGRERVGLLALLRDEPASGAATILAAAIDPAQRGHAYGVRALLVTARRLRRDGIEDLYGRVPRNNGRGVYFFLRAGYAPVRMPADDGTTWFRRAALRRASRRHAPPTAAARGSGAPGDGTRA